MVKRFLRRGSPPPPTLADLLPTYHMYLSLFNYGANNTLGVAETTAAAILQLEANLKPPTQALLLSESNDSSSGDYMYHSSVLSPLVVPPRSYSTY